MFIFSLYRKLPIVETIIPDFLAMKEMPLSLLCTIEIQTVDCPQYLCGIQSYSDRGVFCTSQKEFVIFHMFDMTS
jgi:hypothetical protein